MRKRILSAIVVGLPVFTAMMLMDSDAMSKPTVAQEADKPDKSEEQIELEDSIESMKVVVAIRATELEIEVAKREAFKSGVNGEALMDAAKAKLDSTESQLKIAQEMMAVGQASQSSVQECRLKRLEAQSEIQNIEAKLRERKYQLVVMDAMVRLAELQVKMAEVELGQKQRRLKRLNER